MIKKAAAIFYAFLVFLCYSVPLAAQDTEADKPYEPCRIKVPAGWQANFSPGAAGLLPGSQLKLAATDGLAIYIVQLKSLSSGQWEKMLNDMSSKPAPAFYVLQIAYGSNPGLPPLINSVEVSLPADD